MKTNLGAFLVMLFIASAITASVIYVVVQETRHWKKQQRVVIEEFK